MQVEKATRAEKAFAFLALLVASLPDGEYSADAGRWAKVLSDLRGDYKASYPHLFRSLRFRYAPRADTYSPEVSSFLAFLQFVDGVVVRNPGFTKMEFAQTARELLRETYQKTFDDKDLAAIQQMSTKVADSLRITPGVRPQSV